MDSATYIATFRKEISITTEVHAIQNTHKIFILVIIQAYFLFLHMPKILVCTLLPDLDVSLKN